MSDLKELKHALDIIQQKLNACHYEQRNIINKMSVKRSLLQESFQVLQNNLGTSLKQDLQKKENINNDKNIERLEPIIGTFEIETQEDTVVKEKFKLLQCKGWVRDKRVWIQAKGCPLTDNIQNAHLNLSPNKYSPETTSVNSTSNLKENVITELYLTFDLLDDFIDLEVFKVCCILNDNSFTTAISTIDWINDTHDLTWKEQLMSISLLTNNVIQAYFPCHLSIQHHPDNSRIIENLDLIRLNERLLLSKDQLFVILNDDNDGALDIFGLNNQIVYKIASLFSFISTHGDGTTSKELIKSLGDQYVTLEHNHLNKARLHTALLLSELTTTKK